MAIVIAPMLSVEAHGSLGGAIYAGRASGISHVRQVRAPATRWTSKQRSARAITTFLTKAWAADIIANGIEVNWGPTTGPHNLSNYHRFLRYNQQAWARGTTPVPDIGESPGATPITAHPPTFTPTRTSAAWRFEVTGWFDAWGATLHLATNIFTVLDTTNVAALIDNNLLFTPDTYSGNFTNLTPHTTYYVSIGSFDFAGNWLAFVPHVSSFTTL